MAKKVPKSKKSEAKNVLLCPVALFSFIFSLFDVDLFPQTFHVDSPLGSTAPNVNIFTRALLPKKFLPKGLELVGGGYVINGAYPV